jgi:hypothetical protein
METKRAIEGVLRHVLKSYRFTSLTELNALLSLYNLRADIGGEHSRLRQLGGLIYRVLDKHGNRIGKPVKASALLGKPTLKVICRLFTENEAAKAQQLTRVRNAINFALMPAATSLFALRNLLGKNGIDLVVCSGAVNSAAELIYVDHVQKVVFSGNELGTAYNAASILNRSGDELKIGSAGNRKALTDSGSRGPVNDQTHERKDDFVPNLAEVLLDPAYQPAVPDWLVRRRRKRRKKQVVQPR